MGFFLISMMISPSISDFEERWFNVHTIFVDNASRRLLTGLLNRDVCSIICDYVRDIYLEEKPLVGPYLRALFVWQNEWKQLELANYAN